MLLALVLTAPLDALQRTWLENLPSLIAGGPSSSKWCLKQNSRSFFSDRNLYL